MIECIRLTRRDLLRYGLTGLSGLVIAAYVPRPWLRASEDEAKPFQPNVFVSIEPDGSVIVVVPKSEMGQGIRTGLPMILAEELDADWKTIRVVTADAAADNRYGRQTTGGSTSTRFLWEPLRKAGATARAMLVAAAAKYWKVKPSECTTDRGMVVHQNSKRRIRYADLVTLARSIPIPSDVSLKTPERFRILGTTPHRVDDHDIVTGKARFGLDVRLPGMLFAAVRQCPYFDGDLGPVNLERLKQRPGVVDVVPIRAMREPEWVNAAIGIVATDTWTAIRHAREMDVVWKKGSMADERTADLITKFTEALKKPIPIVHANGDIDAALKAADRVITADYQLPFLSHAPMEPMNATAWFHDGVCEVWVPTQDPQRAQRAIAAVLGMKPENVIVHVTLLGGGFGRRHQPDYAVQAAWVARQLKRPVQLVWTREEDMTHDFYRPATYHRLTAGLDKNGHLVAWEHIILNTRDREYLRNAFPAGAVPHFRLRFTRIPTSVPWGWWRSVVFTSNTFVIQSFLDEVAHAANRDPLEFRLQWMTDPDRTYNYDPMRMRRVIERIARLAEWEKPLPPNHGRGLAVEFCFGSYIAQVAEVSPGGQDGIQVHRVYCAIDCGQVVHPDMVRAQVEGGIVFGLSAALYQAITLESGQVVEKNFDTYPLLRIQNMPEIHVDIVESHAPPGGVGETPVPCIAPAVCNAWFHATGQRIRTLPLVPALRTL